MFFELSNVICQLLRTGIDNETSPLLLHVYLSRLIVLFVVRFLTAIPLTAVDLTLCTVTAYTIASSGISASHTKLDFLPYQSAKMLSNIRHTSSISE